jgi:membrane protease YdiL (CAAX protease family)
LNTLKRIFWNESERRLRAFWRLNIQGTLLLTLLVGLSLLGVVLLLLLQLGRSVLAGEISQFDGSSLLAWLNSSLILHLFNILTLPAVLASVWLAGRFADRRRFADFGLRLCRNWWIDFVFGLALGAGLMTLIFLLELAAGWITVADTFETDSGWPFALAWLVSLAGFVSVGIYEELLDRGYLFKNAAEALSSWGRWPAVAGAVLFSSAVFGISHIINPNATLLSSFNIALVGLFLAVPLVLTGELAIPIGFHIAWNFFQGNVFGFPVSGTSLNETTLIVVEQGGNATITGGAFGPEAGLLGIGATILGTILVLGWLRWRYGRLQLWVDLTRPDLLHPKHLST